MEQVDLESWEEFELKVKEAEDELTALKEPDPHRFVSLPLFRGQRKASWRLDTSIERYLGKPVSIAQYNRYLLRIKPTVEAHTGRRWNVERNFEFKHGIMEDVPNYEFMLYARHHGFPSPLLDWSQSPYIAMFFAYQNAAVDESVAIFMYVETKGGSKGGWVGSPAISLQGSYVSSHQRHFMQQSQYTIATKQENDIWYYCAHDEIFSVQNNGQSDFLTKFTLPGHFKNQYLRKLQKMNINAFTLYGSEESLMDMLAFREIEAVVP